jgi:hypothetical protein
LSGGHGKHPVLITYFTGKYPNFKEENLRVLKKKNNCTKMSLLPGSMLLRLKSSNGMIKIFTSLAFRALS